MKAIFKIEEYLPETKQIVVRFARLHTPEKIEKYATLAIDYDKLDCYSSESFVKSLMREVGNYQVKSNEEKEPIINETKSILQNDLREPDVEQYIWAAAGTHD